MDARRFQRLEESGGEPQRNDVLYPRLAAVTGLEPKRPRVGQRQPIKIGEQRGSCLIVGNVGTRIDIAIANPVLEGDAPLPARRARRRSRKRQMVAAELARDGERAVAGEPFGPILETGLQRLLDEQSAEARAVDEEVG